MEEMCASCASLHDSCYKKNPALVLEVLKLGKIDVNSRDRHQRTPLMNVLLIWRGIECDIKKLKKKIFILTETLIKHGTNLDDQDKDGNTVLHFIAKALPVLKSAKMLLKPTRVILQHGGSDKIRNYNGFSPSEIAYSNYSDKFGNLLLFHHNPNDQYYLKLNTSNLTCPVCFDENKILHSICECGQKICSTCQKKLNRCPFCRKELLNQI